MNQHRFFLIGLLTAILISVAAVTFAQSNDADTLTIAFIGDTESPYVEDTALFDAAQLAAAQINQPEGDDDILVDPNDDAYRLEIVYYSASTPAEALDAYEDALGDDAIAVLTPSRTVADAIAEQGSLSVPVLTAIPDADTETNVVGLFRVTASYDDYAEAAADFLINERKHERVAVISNNSAIALNAAEAFEMAAGSSLITSFTHEPDAQNFRAEAQTLRDDEIDAVFVWTLDDAMLALLDALDAANWDGDVVYAGLDADFIGEQAGIADGVYGVSSWSRVAYDGDSRAFADDYQAFTGSTAPDFAAAYYDAVNLIANGVRQNGAGAQRIQSYLQGTTDTAGVQGVYTGSTIDSVRVLQLRGDALYEVGRYDDGECLSCTDLTIVDTSAEGETSRDTFNIGLIAPQDGVNAANGDNLLNAARLAVQEINERGGVVGPNDTRYTLNVQVYDAGNPDEAASALDSALADGVQVVLGLDSNGQIMPLLYEAQTAATPLLTTATYTRIIQDEPADYVFQLRATDETLARSAADYLFNERDLTVFATVAARTNYGLDAARAFELGANQSSDADVLLQLEHELTDDSAETAQRFAEQIVSAGVQGVAVWTTQPQASALITALETAAWEGVLVYGYLTPDFAETIAQPSGIEIIAPVSWWTNVDDWASEAFIDRYTARYNDEPLPQSVSIYDAIYLLSEGVSAVGGSGSELQSWLLEQQSFVGVVGEYSPSGYEEGEMSQAVTLLSLQGGELTIAARYDDGMCWIGCR